MTQSTFIIKASGVSPCGALTTGRWLNGSCEKLSTCTCQALGLPILQSQGPNQLLFINYAESSIFLEHQERSAGTTFPLAVLQKTHLTVTCFTRRKMGEVQQHSFINNSDVSPTEPLPGQELKLCHLLRSPWVLSVGLALPLT